MNVRKCIYDGLQHLACFGRSDRALDQHLRQVLFGVFHHQVKQPNLAQLAAAHTEQLDQSRMRQFRGPLPAGEQPFVIC